MMAPLHCRHPWPSPEKAKRAKGAKSSKGVVVPLRAAEAQQLPTSERATSEAGPGAPPPSRSPTETWRWRCRRNFSRRPGGDFGPASTFPAGDGPGSVAVGEFNGDADPDLAIANVFSGNVSVLVGAADASFTGPSNFATGAGATSVAAGDFNGDRGDQGHPRRRRLGDECGDGRGGRGRPAPGTDGSIIAYSSTRAGETDIFYEPVAGGNEQRLALAGLDRNPNVSDGLISFERQASAGASRDVYLYDTVADR